MQDFFTCNAAALRGVAPGLQYSEIKKTASSRLLKIMKLTAIFLLATCLQVSANGFTQTTVTLSEKDASLERIFKSIEQQTDYTFFYKVSWIQKAKKITIEVKNSPIEQVLDLCFKDQPLTYSISGKTVSVKLKEPGRTNSLSYGSGLSDQLPFIDVKGRVVNEKGDPVEGVTVNIKGTTTATTTNKNGEFSLASVDPDAILVFTHISLETFELKVSGKTELAISLKTKVSALGDVTVSVSTGYQDIPKERATGSFSKVNNTTLNQQAGTNILKRLEGVTTAVLFDTKPPRGNKTSNITVRGFSSINGPLDPLIVIDGFIYEGDINNINPNMVEDVTILKDAAAASIWGARAANGVIVITTKKGKFNQKLQVDINANVIINSKPDLFYLPQMSTSDYIDVEQFLYNKGYFNNQFTNTSRPALTPAVEIFRKKTLGQITSADSASLIDELKTFDIRDQYNKYFYTNAVTQQYLVGFTGGSSNNAYSLSAGFDNSLTELYGKGQKVNFKIENIFRPVKQLQLRISVLYTNSKSTSGRPSFNSISVGGRLPTYLQFADDYGTPLPIAKDYRDIYTDTAGAGKLLDWKYYPLEEYKHNKSVNNIEELYSILGLNYKLTKFLNFDFNYQYQKQRSELELLQDIESYGARNRINQFSQLNRNTGVVTYIVPLGGIRSLSNEIITTQTGRGQANFNHSWKIHEIVGILGAEIRQSNRNSGSNTIYGYNADPLTFASVDFVNRYPNFVNGFTERIPGGPQYSNKTYRFVSVYSNIAYTFDGKYTISASARRDGSNIFGVNTNSKWKPLWSAGLAWNLSRENFYNSKLIPYLRVRTTYGYSGNVEPSRSAVPVATYSTDPNTNFPVALIGQINNPELRWEKVNTINFGIDFALKNQILSGSIEYYQKHGVDLYGLTTFDYTTFGIVNTIPKNVAEMKGQGMEINLTSKNIDKQFSWITNFLFTFQNHRTTKYYDPNVNISSILGGGNSIYPIIGKPLYAIAAYKWGGLDTLGNPLGYLNKQTSTNYTAIMNEAREKGLDGGNIVYIGSALPKTFGSVINTFSFKGVSLSINISYKLGYYFRKPVFAYDNLIQNGIGHSDYAKRWQNRGDENITNVPSFIYPVVAGRDAVYGLSEINVLKGDHIRLQYINLNYALANFSKIPNILKGTQVYVNASNLGILWRANTEGLDPEYSSSLVPTKAWALGLRASF